MHGKIHSKHCRSKRHNGFVVWRGPVVRCERQLTVAGHVDGMGWWKACPLGARRFRDDGMLIITANRSQCFNIAFFTKSQTELAAIEIVIVEPFNGARDIVVKSEP